MWDRSAEPSPANTARRRNPGPQILRSHALGRGAVFLVIELRAPPSRSMQQGRAERNYSSDAPSRREDRYCVGDIPKEALNNRLKWAESLRPHL